MLLDRLNKGIVIGDGGAIFELERRGYVSAGPFTPEAVVEHPEAVRQLQVDFARAGADVLQAVAYYAHKEKLRDAGVDSTLREINASAVRIAREVADEYGCLVSGNLANTWVYNPSEPASHKETRAQMDEQVEFQIGGGGVDFFIAETMEYLGEARIALEAIKQAGKQAMITMGFKGIDRTLDGVALEDAFKELQDMGADVVGLNCFQDPGRMLPMARRLRAAVTCPVATQPVAYRCSEDKPYFQVLEFEGKVAFPLSLDRFVMTRGEMAAYATEARDMGINYIGACCGAGPHHIRAMAEALGRTVPSSQYSPKLHLHTIIGDEKYQRERDERINCEQRYGVANCHFLPDKPE